MRDKKKRLIVVTYGFHPPEFFANEVGKRIQRIRLEDVVTIKFRPAHMPNNVHDLSDSERWKLDKVGIDERGTYLRKTFGKVNFLLDLHDTPTKRYGTELVYVLSSPGCNVRLGKVLENFAKIQRNKGKKISVFSRKLHKGDFFHSAVLDFETDYHALDANRLESMLNDACNLTIELVNYLKSVI